VLSASIFQVLGKSDFGALLKWRLKMKKYRDSLLAESTAAMEVDNEDAKKAPEPTPEDLDEQLASQLEELRQKAQHKARVEQRKKREKIFKERKRAALNAHSASGFDDTPDEQGLFTLASIKSAKDLAEVDANGKAVLPEVVDSDEEMAAAAKRHGGLPDDDTLHADAMEVDQDDKDGDDDVDDDAAEQRRLELQLDSMFEQFKERRNIVSKAARKKARQVQHAVWLTVYCFAA